MPTRSERLYRLRALVLETVEETIPGLRQTIHKVSLPSSDDRIKNVNLAVAELVDRLADFVLRPPASPADRRRLSGRLNEAIRAFMLGFESLGFAPWISESRAASLARRLDAVVTQACRFLDERDERA